MQRCMPPFMRAACRSSSTASSTWRTCSSGPQSRSRYVVAPPLRRASLREGKGTRRPCRASKHAGDRQHQARVSHSPSRVRAPSVTTRNAGLIVCRRRPVSVKMITSPHEPSVPSDTESTHQATGVDKLHVEGITGTGIKASVSGMPPVYHVDTAPRSASSTPARTTRTRRSAAASGRAAKSRAGTTSSATRTTGRTRPCRTRTRSTSARATARTSRASSARTPGTSTTSRASRTARACTRTACSGARATCPMTVRA
jgi:hypothetical protein